jgi:hypothetical protein
VQVAKKHSYVNGCGAACSTDLGGSSKYSSENLEDRSRGRFPCDQNLYMG